jgi:hypothetical protein
MGNSEMRNIMTSKPRLEDMVGNLADNQAFRRRTEEVVQKILHADGGETWGAERRRDPDHTGELGGEGRRRVEGDDRVEGFKD